MHFSARLLPLLAATLLLAGCEMLGMESTEKLAAAKDAEGRAVGGACRHAGRAIEDCYAMNRKADKAAVFAGWREMNDYMRENKLEAVVPQGVGGSKTEVAAVDADKAKEKEEHAGEVKDADASHEKPAKSASSGKGKGAKAHDS